MSLRSLKWLGPTASWDLQPSRQTSSNRIRSDKGLQGTATLINLNPAVNTWYLLEVDWQEGSKFSNHLENPKPRSQKLVLDAKYPSIEPVEGDAHRSCAFFGGGASDALEQAKQSQVPYVPLCVGRLFLREPVKGHRTNFSWGSVDSTRFLYIAKLWSNKMTFCSGRYSVSTAATPITT